MMMHYSLVKDLVRSRALDDPAIQSSIEYLTLPCREAKVAGAKRNVSGQKIDQIRHAFGQKISDRSTALVEMCFDIIFPDSFEIAAKMDSVRGLVTFGSEDWQTRNSFLNQVH
jgi:hypothetical protein